MSLLDELCNKARAQVQKVEKLFDKSIYRKQRTILLRYDGESENGIYAKFESDLDGALRWNRNKKDIKEAVQKAFEESREKIEDNMCSVITLYKDIASVKPKSIKNLVNKVIEEPIPLDEDTMPRWLTREGRDLFYLHVTNEFKESAGIIVSNRNRGLGQKINETEDLDFIIKTALGKTLGFKITKEGMLVYNGPPDTVVNPVGSKQDR
jgi:hypothetical protein